MRFICPFSSHLFLSLAEPAVSLPPAIPGFLAVGCSTTVARRSLRELTRSLRHTQRRPHRLEEGATAINRYKNDLSSIERSENTRNSMLHAPAMVVPNPNLKEWHLPNTQERSPIRGTEGLDLLVFSG